MFESFDCIIHRGSQFSKFTNIFPEVKRFKRFPHKNGLALSNSLRQNAQSIILKLQPLRGTIEVYCGRVLVLYISPFFSLLLVRNMFKCRTTFINRHNFWPVWGKGGTQTGDIHFLLDRYGLHFLGLSDQRAYMTFFKLWLNDSQSQ